jgi:peptidoglycan hydrolase-like protein with peptidoglycan-binding domain
VPKYLSGSVGVGGRNVPQDVATVQYLLNCLPAGRGGSSPELAIDGLCGPKTCAAIASFQRASGGIQDGRVDPGGPSFRTLMKYDPYPQQSLPPIVHASAKPSSQVSGKQSGYDPYGKHSGYDNFSEGGGYGKTAFDPGGKPV